MPLGLALSGGSVRGMSHIGALRALEEEGLKPDMISGTSAGSIIAALYATGMSVDLIEENVLKYSPCMIDFDVRGAINAVFNLWLLFRGKPVLTGLIKGDRIERIMFKLTEGKKMYETSIPLAITAVDINDGRSIVFISRKIKSSRDSDMDFYDKVRIAEAVRASIAIPSVFRPKLLNLDGRERRLVDGGVVNNLPINLLKLMGASKIIGINLGYCGEREEKVDNILEIGSQTIDVMSYHITKLRNKMNNVIELVYREQPSFFAGRIRQDAVVINPRIYNVSLLDSGKIPECIKRGYDAMKEKLPEVRRILDI